MTRTAMLISLTHFSIVHAVLDTVYRQRNTGVDLREWIQEQQATCKKVRRQPDHSDFNDTTAVNCTFYGGLMT